MHWQRLFLLLLTLCCFGLPAWSRGGAERLRILTYNIRHGAGMDDAIDLDRQAQVIRRAKADVVGLQEVDSVVTRSGSINEASHLAEQLGMTATFGSAIPLSGGKYGVAILSREAPLSVRNIPLPGVEPRTLLVCEFKHFVFACTHLDLDEAKRLASLPIIIDEASRWSKPFFICGDWNDEPSSALLSEVEKHFTLLSKTRRRPGYRTFPADTPAITIDYVARFQTPQPSLGRVIRKKAKSKVLREPQASDHRPVLVEITF